MFIAQWWNALDIASQVFYLIAIPSTLVLVIQTVMMFIGLGENGDGVEDIDDIGGADIDTDTELDTELPEAHEGVFGDNEITEGHDAMGLEGLKIFTVRGIIAFFVVFGWVGIVMQSFDIGLHITLPVAFVCGVAMMVAIAFLLRFVMKLRSDGNIDNRNAIGTSAKVHLTIPPSRTGEGKVHVMLQGAYVERNAVTDSEEAIPTGSEVIIIGVSGQTDLIVRKK